MSNPKVIPGAMVKRPGYKPALFDVKEIMPEAGENVLFKFLPALVMVLWAFLIFSQGRDKRGPQRTVPEMLKLLIAIAGMFALGPILIFTNRTLINELDFNYPLTISLVGHIITLTMVSVFGSCLRKLEGGTNDENVDRNLPWSFYLFRVLPVGLCSVGSLWFGMLSFPLLSVTYNEMLKASTPILTFGGMLMCGVQRWNRGVFFAVALVSGGLAISVRPGGQATHAGIVLMLCSCCTEAGRMVLLQILLQDRKRTFTESLRLMMPSVALCTFVLAACLEWRELAMKSYPFGTIFRICGSGFLGCCSSVLTYWIVSQIGGLSLKALICARSVALVLFSVMFRGDLCTQQGYIGYSLSILGLMFYHMTGYAYPKNAESSGESKEKAGNQADRTLEDFSRFVSGFVSGGCSWPSGEEVDTKKKK